MILDNITAQRTAEFLLQINAIKLNSENLQAVGSRLFIATIALSSHSQIFATTLLTLWLPISKTIIPLPR